MKSFLKSFVYAGEGILLGLRHERNFKIHILAMFVVILAGVLSNLERMEWFIVIILISGMLALELVNSALERVVDLVTKEYHPLAKQAKDLAAGAVFLFAIASAIIGILIFYPKWF